MPVISKFRRQRREDPCKAKPVRSTWQFLSHLRLYSKTLTKYKHHNQSTNKQYRQAHLFIQKLKTMSCLPKKLDRIRGFPASCRVFVQEELLGVGEFTEFHDSHPVKGFTSQGQLSGPVGNPLDQLCRKPRRGGCSAPRATV